MSPCQQTRIHAHRRRRRRRRRPPQAQTLDRRRPVAAARRRPPGRHLVGQRPPAQERRHADLRRARLRDDDRGQGRARCPHRRRQHRRARSRRIRASATAACPMPKGSCSSTPRACTGRASARARSPASKGVRTPSLVAQKVMDYTDHHLHRRPGRAAVRPQHGLQDRGRPQHRAVAQHLARMEAPQRSPRTISIRSSAKRRCARSTGRCWRKG